MVQTHVLLKRWVKDADGQSARLEAVPAGGQLDLSPEEYLLVRHLEIMIIAPLSVGGLHPYRLRKWPFP